MQFLNFQDSLVVIVGPTAVGKTDLSIRLAEVLGAEIVSADSRLLYRGMNIGTAKPSPADQTRVPHHLIDVATPDNPWSLALFQKEAAAAIKAIHQRGRLPILVGGTGQYTRAVIQGWDIPAQAPDFKIRSALEIWAAEIGASALHERLSVIDPDAASIIDPRNVRRTIRALEVIFCTGIKFSSQRKQTGSPYSLMVIGLKRPRPQLYARIDQRIDQMLAEGLVHEVRILLDCGYSPELGTMSAIGYREMAAVIHEKMTLEEAVDQMKRITRRFVRRQSNWFNEKDESIHWFDMDENVLPEILKCINASENWTFSESNNS